MFIHDLARHIAEMRAAGFTPVNKLLDDCHLDQKPANCTGRKISVFCLPWDAITKGMHVTDLLRLGQTCKYFRDLTKNSKFLWKHASYYKLWPKNACLRHFERGEKAGNVEALTKLAMAYLYHEGLSPLVRNESRKVQICGEKAAEMLAALESLFPCASPFTWIFFRPPWSTVPSAKKIVFEEVQKKVGKVDRGNKNLAVSCATVLALMGTEQAETKAMALLEKAAQAGSPHACFSLLLKNRPETQSSQDPGVELARMRELRAIVEQGCPEARLALAKCYAAGCWGGVDQQSVSAFMQSVFRCAHTHLTGAGAANGQMNLAIRYILIDWLIEVATIKDLPSQLVHMAVALMDRFLCLRQVPKTLLQLLGISAMVISSRLIGHDIITIREASWLTDSTYNYEEVVHMITEIIAALQGIMVPTVHDYMEILCVTLDLEKLDCSLVTYLSEMCLLQADLRKFCAKQTAAGCVMLSQLILRAESPWPAQAEDYTQFSKHDVASVASIMYNKCYKETPVVDHRNVALVAVKARFAGSKYHHVSEIEIDEEHDDWILCQLTEFIHKSIRKEETESVDNLDMVIFSPSRNGKAGHRRKRKECQCSTPDNSSDDRYDACDVDDSLVSELPPDGMEESDEELPDSHEPCLLKDAPRFGGFRISDVTISSSFQPHMQPHNCAPSSASSARVTSRASTSSPSSDGDGNDVAVNMPSGSTGGNQSISLSHHQSDAPPQGDIAPHPRAGAPSPGNETLHMYGSDPGTTGSRCTVEVPQRWSTTRHTFQQMHPCHHQAAGEEASPQQTTTQVLAQPGFSGTEPSSATQGVLQEVPEHNTEMCGQQYMALEKDFQQQLHQSGSFRNRRAGEDCKVSLLPHQPSSVEGMGQRSGKLIASCNVRKRSCSVDGGSSALRQPESDRSVCKLRRV